MVPQPECRGEERELHGVCVVEVVVENVSMAKATRHQVVEELCSLDISEVISDPAVHHKLGV